MKSNTFYAFEFMLCAKTKHEIKYWTEEFKSRRENFMSKNVVVAEGKFFSRIRVISK